MLILSIRVVTYAYAELTQSNNMRKLSMRIVTRHILRQRITIENSNILANFLIKLKSLEILILWPNYCRLDLCKKNRRRKSHAWAPLKEQ
jgi:hypothetical protein